MMVKKDISITSHMILKRCSKCIVGPICSEFCDPVKEHVATFIKDWNTYLAKNSSSEVWFRKVSEEEEEYESSGS